MQQKILIENELFNLGFGARLISFAYFGAFFPDL
jgi:hypothetical protein